MADIARDFYSQDVLDKIDAFRKSRREQTRNYLRAGLTGGAMGAAGRDVGAVQGLLPTTRIGSRRGDMTQTEAENLALQHRKLRSDGNVVLLDLQKALEGGDVQAIQAAMSAQSDNLEAYLKLAGTTTTAGASAHSKVAGAQVAQLGGLAAATKEIESTALLATLPTTQKRHLVEFANEVAKAQDTGGAVTKEFDSSVAGSLFNYIETATSEGEKGQQFAYIRSRAPAVFERLKEDATWGPEIRELEASAAQWMLNAEDFGSIYRQYSQEYYDAMSAISSGANAVPHLQRLDEFVRQQTGRSIFPDSSPEAIQDTVERIRESGQDLEDNPLFGLVTEDAEDFKEKIQDLEDYSEDFGKTEAQALREDIQESAGFQQFKAALAEEGPVSEGQALRMYIRGGKKTLRESKKATRDAARGLFADPGVPPEQAEEIGTLEPEETLEPEGDPNDPWGVGEDVDTLPPSEEGIPADGAGAGAPSPGDAGVGVGVDPETSDPAELTDEELFGGPVSLQANLGETPAEDVFFSAEDASSEVSPEMAEILGIEQSLIARSPTGRLHPDIPRILRNVSSEDLAQIRMALDSPDSSVEDIYEFLQGRAARARDDAAIRRQAEQFRREHGRDPTDLEIRDFPLPSQAMKPGWQQIVRQIVLGGAPDAVSPLPASREVPVMDPGRATPTPVVENPDSVSPGRTLKEMLASELQE